MTVPGVANETSPGGWPFRSRVGHVDGEVEGRALAAVQGDLEPLDLLLMAAAALSLVLALRPASHLATLGAKVHSSKRRPSLEATM
jgi:hypothetical protein